MMMETPKYSKSIIQQAYKTATNKYSTSEQCETALQILATCALLTEAIKEEARIARRERWADQCKRIVTAKERELSEIWFRLSLSREVDQDLAAWINGKVIGEVRDNVLVVELHGQTISVMKKEYAEAMSFESFDGKFRLTYDSENQSMIISDFISTIKSRARSNA